MLPPQNPAAAPHHDKPPRCPRPRAPQGEPGTPRGCFVCISHQRCVGCCCFLFWQKLHCQQWMHQNKKLINNTHRQQFSKHTSCFKRHDTDLLSKFQANSSQKKIFATSCPLNIAFFTNVCCLFHGILYLFLNSTNGSLKNNFFSTEGKLRHG